MSLKGSTGLLHTNTHTCTSSLTIISGHNLTQIIHYHRASFLKESPPPPHTHTRTRCLLLFTKRLGHPQANHHTGYDVKPELFGQKVIDHILLFCSWRRLPVAQKMAGSRFVRVWQCMCVFALN